MLRQQQWRKTILSDSDRLPLNSSGKPNHSRQQLRWKAVNCKLWRQDQVRIRTSRSRALSEAAFSNSKRARLWLSSICFFSWSNWRYRFVEWSRSAAFNSWGFWNSNEDGDILCLHLPWVHAYLHAAFVLSLLESTPRAFWQPLVRFSLADEGIQGFQGRKHGGVVF